MQGYIVKLSKVKEEDIIVSVITKDAMLSLYRFYGARHSPINMGFKIDFESESSAKTTILRMKDLIHIGFKWIGDYNKLRLWQQFISLFHPHLRDTDYIDSFYYELLDDAAFRWDKQDPKRVAIESYIKLLDFEGRLHNEFECFFCGEEIGENVSIIRAFLPAHYHCSHTLFMSKKALAHLYKNSSTLYLGDREIERLWYILCEGL